MNAFTVNSEYGPNGTSRLEQDPLFVLEYHLSRNLSPGFWLSADAYYNTGGETKIDGIPQDNAADTLRIGCGAGLSAWSGVQLIFNYEDVVAKPVSEPDSQTFRIKMQKIW
jgi:hypothetical protein